MRDDPSWRRQYHDEFEWKYDRELILYQIEENGEDIECLDKQVRLNTIRIGKIWMASAVLKVVIATLVAFLGILIGLLIKLAPLITKITKLVEDTSPK
jgi:hypothetical protein